MKIWRFILLILVPAPLLAQSEDAVMAAYHNAYRYEQAGNHADAIKALMPVYAAYPKTYTVNMRLGWLYFLHGKYANALSNYDAAARAAPYSLEPQLGRLLVLLAQENYGQVEKEAFRILNTDFYSYYGNLRLAVALRKRDKLDVAGKIVDKMLAVYPLDVLFLTEYALIRHAALDTSAAAGAFRSVLILDPENVTARAYLRGDGVSKVR